jgi:TRAP-type uncharacterized transport system substrate-binding protein
MKSYQYIAIVIKDEALSFYKFIRESIGAIVLALAFLFILIWSNVIFNDHVYLASDQSNTSWALYSSRAKEELDQNGIEVTLIDTVGFEESIKKTDNSKDKANVSFAYGAALSEGQTNEIYSLGSIDYEPVWIFYKKSLASKIKSPADFAHYRVGYGPKEGGTYKIAEKFLKANGIDINKNPNTKTGIFESQITDFLNGDLDVLVRITAIDNPMVLDLLKNPDVDLFDLSNAFAFQKNMSYLTAFNIVAGSLDLLNQIPKKDTNVVAVTTSLVVNRGINPGLQLILLMVAKDSVTKANRVFLAKRNEFPAYIDPLIPLSPVAKKYYDYGPPSFSRYFSYRVAAFIDRLWPVVLILFAIFFPISRITWRFRELRTSVEEYPFYERLIGMESTVAKGGLSADQKKAFHLELNGIKNAIAKNKIHTGYEIEHYDLLKAIELIQSRIDEG